MDANDYQRELLAYSEKIQLGKLECAKAEERVAELEFELARFQMSVFLAQAKASQKETLPPPPPAPEVKKK